MVSRNRTGTPRSTGGQPSAAKSGSAYCPDAGDVVWVDLDPTEGHEQRGRRPAVVITSAEYNRRARLCLACPITNQSKGYPFEVPIPPGGTVTGVVLSDQVRALAWPERNAQLMAKIAPAVLDDVREKLGTLIEAV